MKSYVMLGVLIITLYSCKSDKGSSSSESQLSTNTNLVSESSSTSPQNPETPVTQPAVSTPINSYEIISDTISGFILKNNDKIFYSNAVKKYTVYDEISKSKIEFDLDYIKTFNLSKSPQIGSYDPSCYNILYFTTPTKIYVACTGYYYKASLSKYVEELFIGELTVDRGLVFVDNLPGYKISGTSNFTYGEILYVPIESNSTLPPQDFQLTSYDPLASSKFKLIRLALNSGMFGSMYNREFSISKNGNVMVTYQNEQVGDSPFATFINFGNDYKIQNQLILPMKILTKGYINFNDDMIFVASDGIYVSDINFNQKKKISTSNENKFINTNNFLVYYNSSLGISNVNSLFKKMNLTTYEVTTTNLTSFPSPYDQSAYKPTEILLVSNNCFYAKNLAGNLIKSCTK